VEINIESSVLHYHCHQAIEKILKTAIVAKKKEPKRIHDLIKLSYDTKLKFPFKFQNYISKLNVHYQPSRYPDIHYKHSVLEYNFEIAKYHLKETKELFKWIEKKITLRK
jgi:HEPN domain-containing protein